MADRIVDLKSVPEVRIAQAGYEWYLSEEYLVPEAIEIKGSEIDGFRNAAITANDYFIELVGEIIDKADWDDFNLPIAMRELIQYSFANEHMHLLGRFDFGGGIESLPLGLLEYNADTPTMLPESAYFQDFFRDEVFNRKWFQFNFLYRDLVESFKVLLSTNKDKSNTLVITTMGYIEDQLNVKVIEDAAKEAGFEVHTADLEYLAFEDDGVYLEFEEGEELKFDYMFKLVPWEFIMYEEPELLDILRDLVIEDKLYIMNPAYSILMQSKAILTKLWTKFRRDPMILQASFDKNQFRAVSHVEKVTFGRLGENIKIYDTQGRVLEETDGDFGDFPSVFQRFTSLYKDDENHYYQAGVFVTNGKPCSLSFRRCETMIIDDDAEYLPHFMPR